MSNQSGSPRSRAAGWSTLAFLTPPMLWLGVAYLGALAALLLTAFWSVDEFTGAVVRTFTLDNLNSLLTNGVYRTVALRTVGIAVVVTIIDAVLALPIAFFMAKVASARWQRILVIAVLMPLWASYLVKAYAWRAMLSHEGPLASLGIHLGYGLTGLVITLAYLWLPFMILPVYAGFQRLPASLLEASADLGASFGTTLRRVIVPSVFPSLVAGSIFTFSLSLGDYVAVKIVGGPTQVLGGVVYQSVGTANDLPFAAALAFVPVVVMLVYLWAVRRTGALENL
ncbi:ABC transporter permease [Nocardioides sp. Kera G14]|uniref:ABC transporter permease n=1 Tax=Nocardioides sp. Kera G14 TaxID=2884264 RepID=UPI001D1010D9|nr:ABC transporter permease [Nocardioides sp. Kera G14]UDY22585.1 ABC transporter permease [Nocardioides sp. Kera G14]